MSPRLVATILGVAVCIAIFSYVQTARVEGPGKEGPSPIIDQSAQRPDDGLRASTESDDSRIVPVPAHSGPEQAPSYQSPEAARQAVTDRMVSVFGDDETAFRLKLIESHGESWSVIRQLLDDRAKATGQNYDEMKMYLGMASGEMTVDEMQQLLHAGVPMPESIVVNLAGNGQIDEIVELDRRGLISSHHLNMRVGRPNRLLKKT